MGVTAAAFRGTGAEPDARDALNKLAWKGESTDSTDLSSHVGRGSKDDAFVRVALMSNSISAWFTGR